MSSLGEFSTVLLHCFPQFPFLSPSFSPSPPLLPFLSFCPFFSSLNLLSSLPHFYLSIYIFISLSPPLHRYICLSSIAFFLNYFSCLGLHRSWKISLSLPQVVSQNLLNFFYNDMENFKGNKQKILELNLFVSHICDHCQLLLRPSVLNIIMLYFSSFVCFFNKCIWIFMQFLISNLWKIPK